MSHFFQRSVFFHLMFSVSHEASFSHMETRCSGLCSSHTHFLLILEKAWKDVPDPAGFADQNAHMHRYLRLDALEIFVCPYHKNSRWDSLIACQKILQHSLIVSTNILLNFFKHHFRQISFSLCVSTGLHFLFCQQHARYSTWRRWVWSCLLMYYTFDRKATSTITYWNMLWRAQESLLSSIPHISDLVDIYYRTLEAPHFKLFIEAGGLPPCFWYCVAVHGILYVPTLGF